MDGHAPPLGPLLERTHLEEDDTAPPQRQAHAGTLARMLRDAALARDWPRAAALASLGLLAQPARKDKQSVYSFGHNVSAVLPLAQMSVEVAQTHPETFSVEDELALRREARRRALTRDDVAAAEAETMQSVALLAVRGEDTARAAAELGRRPSRRGGAARAASSAAAAARARLAALLAYSQWAALAVPRPPPSPGGAPPTPFDPPSFPAGASATAKALRNAALPLMRDAFAAAPTDPVLAGALMALQAAGKGAKATRRALHTGATLARAAPDDPEAWRLYRLALSALAARTADADGASGGDEETDAALRRAACAELRCDPASESALAALLDLRARRACSASLALASAADHAEVCPACPTAWRYLASALGAPPRRHAAERAAAVWTPERAALWRSRFFTLGGRTDRGALGPFGAAPQTFRDVAVVAAHLRAAGPGGGAFGRAAALRLVEAGHPALAADVRAAHRMPPASPAEVTTAWDIGTSAFELTPQHDARAPPSPGPAAVPASGEALQEADEQEKPDYASMGPCADCYHKRLTRLVCRMRRCHTAPPHRTSTCEVCGPAAAAAAASTLPPGRCTHCAHARNAPAHLCRLVFKHAAPPHVAASCDACRAANARRRARKMAAAADPDAPPRAAKKARTGDA